MGDRERLLDELSERLGTTILGVTSGPAMRQNYYEKVNDRKPFWSVGYTINRLCHCGENHGPKSYWQQIGPSGTVRNPRKLTALARRLGRPYEWPALTAEDGRAILKLMHRILNTVGEDHAAEPRARRGLPVDHGAHNRV